MDTVFYKPADGWVGDLIPFSHENLFYLFYLHDTRRGETQDDYGFGTTWNLLVTADGTEIEDKGVILPTGGIEDADLSCYTGSVVRGPDGVFHLFYTAQNSQNPKYCRAGKPMQYIMQATSRDLTSWEKHYDTLFGADERLYEVFDWRDPYVYFSEEAGEYHMLLAAREQGASQKNGGCIALCTSPDLWHWKVQKPFYSPGAYLTHECPDLFRWGGWWYLVYSTFSERFVTHYRMARSPQGPWLAPPEDSFDGRGFYAAKTAEKGGERWAFAWVPTKRGENDFGMWEWGGALVMHKLHQLPSGKLMAGIPPAIQDAFTKEESLCGPTPQEGAQPAICLCAEDGRAERLFENLPAQFLLEATVAFSSGIRNFGLGLRLNDEQTEGYFFRLEPFYNRVVFDLWPRRSPGVNQWYIDGDKPFALELERPYQMSGLRQVELRLLVEGSIATLYVDDAVALTTRMYRTQNTGWSLFAFDGSVEVTRLKLKTRA